MRRALFGTVLYSASYIPPIQLQDDVHIVIQKKEIRRTSYYPYSDLKKNLKDRR